MTPQELRQAMEVLQYELAPLDANMGDTGSLRGIPSKERMDLVGTSQDLVPESLPIIGNYQMQGDPTVNQGPYQPPPNMLDVVAEPRRLTAEEMAPRLSMRPEDIIARREFGPDVQLSYSDRLTLRNDLSPLIQQRMHQATQLLQLQEQRRQHDLQLFEKAMASPRGPLMMEALAEDPNYQLAPQAKQFSRVMKEADYGAFEAYKEFIPPEIQQRFIQGKLPDYELKAWVDEARAATLANTKEAAKSTIVKRALDKDPKARTPYEQQLVEEREAALNVKEADELLKLSQTYKNMREGDQGKPDHTTLGRIHQMISGGKSFEQGTTETQRQALDQYAKLYPEGRTTVTANTPVGQLGKAQEFRDPVSGKAAPSWATQADLERLGYVNVETSQVPTINQLSNVDAALKEILDAGTTLLRKSGGKSWFEVPKGIAQIPLVNLFSKYAGDPDAQVLRSAINRITPTLSRLGGDVANVAVAEREMYAQSIFDPADTVESFATKIKSVQRANARTRQSMGFVPDEQSYVRQLVIRGYTDEQIKASLAERKRYQ